MHIIPVIDLKNGVVVSAQQGQRNTYQPIQSLLASSASMDAIINGFLSLHPFTIIYIADLDAITQTGNNDALIHHITQHYPDIQFWVDNGSKLQHTQPIYQTNYKRIIGSESQNLSPSDPHNLSLKNHILSLDFFPEQGYVGSQHLLDHPEYWSEHIIIMSLDKVGNNAGVDRERLHYFTQTYPDKTFIAAGGVRNKKDLIQLQKLGINHVLIASALHSGAYQTDWNHLA